jgi:hypothetical protein
MATAPRASPLLRVAAGVCGREGVRRRGMPPR